MALDSWPGLPACPYCGWVWPAFTAGSLVIPAHPQPHAMQVHIKMQASPREQPMHI